MELKMTFKNALLAGTVLGVAALYGVPANAQTQSSAPAASQAQLQAQIDDLSQQLDDLKVRLGSQIGEVRKAQAEAPTVTLANGRPTIATQDGRFSIALRGRFHYDTGLYFQQDEKISEDQRGTRDLSSGTNFRRAELGVEGFVFRDWFYNLNYQFGGSGAEDAGKVKEAYIQYRGIKPLRITVGAYQEPLTMEDSTSSNEILFMERPEITNVITDQLGGEGRSVVGAQANGENWFTSHYIVGTTVTTAATFDEQVGYAGRAAYSMPFMEGDARVHAGVSGGYIFSPSQTRNPTTAVTTADYGIQLRDRPMLRVDGTRLIDTGSLNAQNFYTVGGELAANWKNFYVQGEYYAIQLDRELLTTVADASGIKTRNTFSGGYVQASWVLTGETRVYKMDSATYGAPKVAEPFSLSSGSIGALELKARYSYINLNDNEGDVGSALATGAVRGGEEQVMGIGLNWYPNNNIRVMVDYLNVSVDRLGTFNGTAGQQVGQEFNALGIRTQFAF